MMMNNEMISNYECSNFYCGYTTGRKDNLKMKDLNAFVEKEGGHIEGDYTCCPACKKNSLAYVGELKTMQEIA